LKKKDRKKVAKRGPEGVRRRRRGNGLDLEGRRRVEKAGRWVAGANSRRSWLPWRRKEEDPEAMRKEREVGAFVRIVRSVARMDTKMIRAGGSISPTKVSTGAMLAKVLLGRLVCVCLHVRADFCVCI